MNMQKQIRCEVCLVMQNIFEFKPSSLRTQQNQKITQTRLTVLQQIHYNYEKQCVVNEG